MNEAKTYYRIVKGIAQLLSLSGLYDLEHPVVKEKLILTFREISGFMASANKTLIIAKSADVFFVNGEKIGAEEKLIKRFVESFIRLNLGSMEFAHGITKEELGLVMRILSQKEHLQGADKVKEFLKNNNSSHVIVREATFKLVQEDERIIKKGGVIKIDELPPELVNRFSQDLIAGKVSSMLKGAGEDYRSAAHNADLVAGLAFDMVKNEAAPQSLEKVLWMVSDYLIGEISTTKEEDVNRKVLDEIKAYFISHLKEKRPSDQWEKEAHRTFAVIDTALQLKGLVELYKKHKKGMAATLKKIQAVLNNLPPDSELCRKTRAELEERA